LSATTIVCAKALSPRLLLTHPSCPNRLDRCGGSPPSGEASDELATALESTVGKLGGWERLDDRAGQSRAFGRVAHPRQVHRVAPRDGAHLVGESSLRGVLGELGQRGTEYGVVVVVHRNDRLWTEEFHQVGPLLAVHGHQQSCHPGAAQMDHENIQ
jgi:hypothetical protein